MVDVFEVDVVVDDVKESAKETTSTDARYYVEVRCISYIRVVCAITARKAVLRLL